MCKIVQPGHWAGIVEYEKVSLLPLEKKKLGVLSVLDVKPFEHKEQKPKLLLTKDRTVYKFKRIFYLERGNKGQFVLAYISRHFVIRCITNNNSSLFL